MKRFLVVLLLAVFFFGLLGSLAFGQGIKPVPDPIGDAVRSVQIQLPMVPVLVEPDEIDEKPDPPPRPKPRGPVPVSVLSEDCWYVIESPFPLIVIHSPDGFVDLESVERELKEPPVMVRGRFADGTGKVETRHYSSRFLYFLTGQKSGKIELQIQPKMVAEHRKLNDESEVDVVIFSGARSEKDILRQSLTVVMGQGPNPPPIPDPKPDPKPDPDPPVPGDGLRVFLLFNEDANRDVLNTVNSTKIVQWMVANASAADGEPNWRRWDRTSIAKPDMLANETPAMKELWGLISPRIPAGNVVVAVKSGNVYTHPMAGPEDTLSFLESVRTGKAVQ